MPIGTRLEPSNEQIIRRTLADLQLGLKKLYGRRAPEILLFGSYARGEASDESDIDVLLVYPGDVNASQEIRRVSALLAELNLRYQTLVSVVPVSQENFKNNPGMFWKNVRREGISVNAI